MRRALIIIAAISLTGCVTRQTIPEATIYDAGMTCAELEAEAVSMGGEVKEREKTSGITGKNVVSGLLFWPGIILNEVNSSRNVSDAQARADHLTRLYYDKDCHKVAT